jgi:hypothetical protein
MLGMRDIERKGKGMITQFINEFQALPWLAQFVILIGSGVIGSIIIGTFVDRVGSWSERRRWERRWRAYPYVKK